MPEVNIYITVMAHGIRPAEGVWSHVLETKKGDEIKTKGRCATEQDATTNSLVLMALCRALERMKQPCRITVYTDNAYLAGAVNQNWLDIWEHNGWKTARGEQVKNSDIWQEIARAAMEHELCVELCQEHSYRSWQETQMKHLGENVKSLDFT